tara:strand:- start:927 stop:1202 length:276 start_codon:yes stop_codon:yes gene_type:complete
LIQILYNPPERAFSRLNLFHFGAEKGAKVASNTCETGHFCGAAFPPEPAVNHVARSLAKMTGKPGVPYFFRVISKRSLIHSLSRLWQCWAS